MKVFDASAALAVVFAEPGAERAERLLEDGDAVISSVNHAEVVARLLERGMREAEADAVCDALRLQVLPFTAAQARASGRLRPATRPWACRSATVVAWPWRRSIAVHRWSPPTACGRT